MPSSSFDVLGLLADGGWEGWVSPLADSLPVDSLPVDSSLAAVRFNILLPCTNRWL